MRHPSHPNPNPYASAPWPPHPAAPRPRPAAAPRDGLWWLPPALCTPLALLIAYLNQSAMPLPTAWFVVYAPTLALLVASWLVPATRTWRGGRIAFGACACLLAFVLHRLLAMVVYGLIYALWRFFGGG
ncbi:hypothetical protein ACQB60_05950 [Actinomycetota bacterium Odt1-20B]